MYKKVIKAMAGFSLLMSLSVKAIFAASAFMLSTIAVGAESGWTPYSTVKKMVVTSGGGINVELDPALED